MENQADILSKIQLIESKIDFLVKEAQIAKRNRIILLFLTIIFVVLPFIAMIFVLPSAVSSMTDMYQI